MQKVVRVPLKFNTSYKDGTIIPYKDMCNLLKNLQYETREIKNKAVQVAWEYSKIEQEYKEQNGSYPKEKDVLGTNLQTYVEHKLKGSYKMSAAMKQTIIRLTVDKFGKNKSDFRKGLRSIDEYKANQPLDIKAQTLRLDYINNKFILKIGILNAEYAKENNLPTQFTFEANLPLKAKSSIAILERCYDKIYKIAGSKLLYDKKNDKWFLNLAYEFEKENHFQLDSNKILGVDLGSVAPLTASIYGEQDRLMFSGKKLEYLRQRTEKRKKSALEASVVCGDGSIGHGYHTRTKAAERIGDKIARFRDTVNHSFSRELINYAIKHGCGTIQMEDLTRVTQKANRFLKNWSYFDLQTKIEYKAKEQGINVVYIQPYYTSKRCSKCGFIHENNRVTQANFKCLSCGYTENADYNASQNIAIRDIDKIISADMKQK